MIQKIQRRQRRDRPPPATPPPFRIGSFELRMTITNIMKQLTLQLSPNGKGATLYLPRDILDDTGCPLEQGDRVSVRMKPGIGILLTTSRDETSYIVRARNR